MNADHITDLATHACIASLAVGHVLGLLVAKAVVNAAVGANPWI